MYNEGTVYSLGGEYINGDGENIFMPQGDMYVSGDIILDNQVYTYMLEEDCWREHSFMLSKRKRHQAVVCNGKIYAIGGTNELSRTLDSVEVLDLSMGSLEWEEVQPMQSKRVSHGAVVINNAIYVVGGWDGQAVVQSVERMLPGRNEWSVIR